MGQTILRHRPKQHAPDIVGLANIWRILHTCRSHQQDFIRSDPASHFQRLGKMVRLVRHTHDQRCSGSESHLQLGTVYAGREEFQHLHTGFMLAKGNIDPI